jgi:hypothetical protein
MSWCEECGKLHAEKEGVRAIVEGERRRVCAACWTLLAPDLEPQPVDLNCRFFVRAKYAANDEKESGDRDRDQDPDQNREQDPDQEQNRDRQCWVFDDFAQASQELEELRIVPLHRTTCFAWTASYRRPTGTRNHHDDKASFDEHYRLQHNKGHRLCGRNLEGIVRLLDHFHRTVAVHWAMIQCRNNGFGPVYSANSQYKWRRVLQLEARIRCHQQTIARLSNRDRDERLLIDFVDLSQVSESLSTQSGSFLDVLPIIFSYLDDLSMFARPAYRRCYNERVTAAQCQATTSSRRRSYNPRKKRRLQ